MDQNSEHRHNHRHDPERSRRHSSGHSHRRHHHHSSGSHAPASKPYRYERRPRLEDNPKREKAQKIESFFSRNILTFFGIIFIAGAIWFSTDNWRSISNYIGQSIEKSKTVEFNLKNKTEFLVSSVFSSAPLKSSQNFHDTNLVLFLVLAMIFILTSLGLAIHRKNLLLKTLSFAGWILITSWLLIKFIITEYYFLFWGILLISTICFTLFFISGFVDSYVSRRRWKYTLEYILIIFNGLFYFFTVLVILHKSGFRMFEPVFTFLLSALYLFSFFSTDKRNISYNKVPYLISALIVICSFLPMILKVNPVIVFLSPLSVFLVIFSKYSRNQTSVLFSLLAMVFMAVIYYFQWSLEFLPAIINEESVVSGNLFFKGLVGGFFMVLALGVNNIFLRKYAVHYSIKWVRKMNPLKLLKGILLATIYLTGYWIFHYIVLLIAGNIHIKILTWFTFNCLFFIFYIPYLGWQRSSYFRIVIIAAIISSLASFTFVHLSVLQIRTHYLETIGASLLPFILHYVPVGLLILMLFTLLHYFKRSFPGKKSLIKGFWIYFYLMCTFLLLAEFSHLAVIYQHSKGTMADTAVFNTQKLPYSFLLILSAITLLTVGFNVKSRFLRISSLVVIGIVLVKILVYDVITLNPQSKIILLFILGVSLLGVSVTYPKIKRSFFEKDAPQSHEDFSAKRKHRR